MKFICKNLSLTTKELKVETFYIETKEKDSPASNDDGMVNLFIKYIILLKKYYYFKSNKRNIGSISLIIIICILIIYSLHKTKS